jgi:hypothetical protein
MSPPTSDGWNESAAAWLLAMGRDCDYGRKFVLDETRCSTGFADVVSRARSMWAAAKVGSAA